jgi:hypothetical protein
MCHGLRNSSLGQGSRDVVTTSINNGLPGVWKCVHICCNGAGWDPKEQIKALLLALIHSELVTWINSAGLPHPLVHISIYPAMHVLNGLIALW